MMHPSMLETVANDRRRRLQSDAEHRALLRHIDRPHVMRRGWMFVRRVVVAVRERARSLGTPSPRSLPNTTLEPAYEAGHDAVINLTDASHVGSTVGQPLSGC